MTTIDAGVDVVVFDLGGVLVQLSGVETLRALAGIESRDEIIRRWLECRWVRRFESGGCSPEAFAAGVVADWTLPVDADEFLDSFRSWPEDLYEGAAELVADVRAVRRVACLSNTNAVHWEVHVSKWAMDEMFDDVFLSFRIGGVKPDAAVFRDVATALGTTPERVLLLDDSRPNVEGARAAGLCAALVEGPAAARKALVGARVLGGSERSLAADDDGREGRARTRAGWSDRPMKETEATGGS